ncbi:hypothetical protein D3C72_1256330 [compost metagenome]
MAAADGHAVDEDHAHGVFQHGKRQGTEKQHGQQQQPADHAAVVEEMRDLGHDGFRLPGYQPFQVMAYGLQQFVLRDHVRQGHHHQHQQGHDGQQRVIRDGARQQQALIGAETLQHLQHEGQRVDEDVGTGVAVDHVGYGEEGGAASCHACIHTSILTIAPLHRTLTDGRLQQGQGLPVRIQGGEDAHRYRELVADVAKRVAADGRHA